MRVVVALVMVTACGRSGFERPPEQSPTQSDCQIDGDVLTDGTLNPSNPCQSCQSSLSTSTWTDSVDGASCGSGLICDAASCQSGCWIGGAFRANGSLNPSSGCQSCQAALSTSTWTNTADGTGCGSDLICNNGSCVSGCWIGSAFRADGSLNPLNPCQSCQSHLSRSAWTAAADGTPCDSDTGSGEICNDASCESACWIANAFQPNGTLNPTDFCQSCQPQISTSAWTDISCDNIAEACIAGTCTLPRFVAVRYDDTNAAAYSYDGIDWLATTMPSSGNWRAATHGDGGFVAVKRWSAQAAHSFDGIYWIETMMPLSGCWFSVVHAADQFVSVCAADNVAAYSPDGINWTQTPLPSTSYWRSVTYGDNMFATVALSTDAAACSSDGIAWSAATMPATQDWYSITFGGDRFVAVALASAQGAYSDDGCAWTAMTLPASGNWYSVAYGDDKFVAVRAGSDQAALSANGIEWNTTTLPSASAWQFVTFCTDRFIATSDGTAGAVSEDGYEWTAFSLPSSGEWQGVGCNY